MKRIILVSTFFLIFTSFMQINAQWARTYGIGDFDWFCSIQQTNDGGYIVGGVAGDCAGCEDFWALKLYSNGAIEWQRSYGVGSNSDWLYSIQQTSDGGYIVAGGTLDESAYTPIHESLILKLSSNGDIEWQRTYGVGQVRSIQQTSDGGYIAASGSWVFKLSTNGDIEWQSDYSGGDAYSIEVRTIQQTIDGGYVVVCYSYPDPLNEDYLILKLTSNGAIEWQRTYGGSNGDYPQSIQQTIDGGYIVAGLTRSFGEGNTDFWVLKLNYTGDIEWQRTYGGSAYSIQQTNDGGFIVGGMADFDYLILKLSSNGDIDPSCGDFIGSSDANVLDTNIIPQDTNIIPQDTNIIPQDTNISPQDTDATVTLLCSAPILENQPPVALFSYFPENPVAGEEITFDASESYDPDGYIEHYAWSFYYTDSEVGYCDPGSGKITKFSYSSPGNYFVKLVVFDNNQESSSASRIITVVAIEENHPPVASFSYSPENPWVNVGIDFDASGSYDPDGDDVVYYKWEFGDGYFDHGDGLINYTYSYNRSGTYSVKLTVKDSKGAIGTLELGISVLLFPDWVTVEDILEPKLEHANLDNVFGKYLRSKTDLYNIINEVLNYEQGKLEREGNYGILENTIISHMHILLDQMHPDLKDPFLKETDIGRDVPAEADLILRKIHPIGKEIYGIFTNLGPGLTPYLISQIPIAIMTYAAERAVLDLIELYVFGDMGYAEIEWSPFGKMEIVFSPDIKRIYINTYLIQAQQNIFISIPIEFQKPSYDDYIRSIMWVGITRPPELAVRMPIPDLQNVWRNISSLRSPGELRVYDLSGNITGQVDGEIKEEIPDSQFVNGTAILFTPTEYSKYEVKGTEEGLYGLSVASIEFGGENAFVAMDIPIAGGEVHEYTFDWEALSQGEEGATVRIDSEGDGIFEIVITSGGTFAFVSATVNIEPDTMNIKSKGKLITSYIELPEGYDANNIDISTIELKIGEVLITEVDQSGPNEIGDYDQDNIPDLMVKFDRAIVIQYLKDNNLTSGNVTLAVVGQVNDKIFAGTDTIRINEKGDE